MCAYLLLRFTLSISVFAREVAHQNELSLKSTVLHHDFYRRNVDNQRDTIKLEASNEKERATTRGTVNGEIKYLQIMRQLLNAKGKGLGGQLANEENTSKPSSTEREGRSEESPRKPSSVERESRSEESPRRSSSFERESRSEENPRKPSSEIRSEESPRRYSSAERESRSDRKTSVVERVESNESSSDTPAPIKNGKKLDMESNPWGLEEVQQTRPTRPTEYRSKSSDRTSQKPAPVPTSSDRKLAEEQRPLVIIVKNM